MKRIYVNVTEDEFERLNDIAVRHDASPGEMLADFAADLTYSNRRGGSDESECANDWLSRQTYRWTTGKLS